MISVCNNNCFRRKKNKQICIFSGFWLQENPTLHNILRLHHVLLLSFFSPLRIRPTFLSFSPVIDWTLLDQSTFRSLFILCVCVCFFDVALLHWRVVFAVVFGNGLTRMKFHLQSWEQHHFLLCMARTALGLHSPHFFLSFSLLLIICQRWRMLSWIISTHFKNVKLKMRLISMFNMFWCFLFVH